MNWIQYWPLLEVALIVIVFAIIIWRLLRSAKRRDKFRSVQRPTTIGEKIWFVVLYFGRLLGVGIGTFLAIALVVMIERNILSVITETAPAPSQVEIPPNLPFDVEEITFLSEDGLRMGGWYAPPENGALVILLHGYGSNRTAMIWHAEQMTKAGYGVLMYDERASGESEGEYRSYGWEDPRDVGGALAFLSDKSEVDSNMLGIAGCSIGGQIALQGAAYYPQIGAVWADGPSTIRAQDIKKPTNPIYALLIAANYMLDWMFEIKLGIDAPAPMLEIIDDIAPRPIMLVGGGTSMPFTGSEGDHLEIYKQYAGETAELWVILEAVHCDGPIRRPEEYATKMKKFFDTTFDIERR
ncbi:MAG: alpha/beta hydrolase [Anaerolineales bacterium]